MPLGEIGLPEIQAWATATEARRWEPQLAIDIGWLCLEAAVTQHLHPGYASENRATQYDSHVLLGRASEYWRDITLKSANSALLRSQAGLALGALDPYRAIIERGEINYVPIYSAQVDAAALLHGAYKRFRDTALLHDLHAQTMMLLFNGYSENNDGILLPLPSRFQEEGNDNRADLVLWKNGADGYMRAYQVRVSAQEGGRVGEDASIMNIWPALLENENYPPNSRPGTQGTTMALVEQFNHKHEARNFSPLYVAERIALREAHLTKVATNVWSVLGQQINEGARPVIEIDALTELDRAKTWYRELRPNYRFRQGDAAQIEQYINPFEVLVGAADNDVAVADAENQLSPEDLYMMAWMRMELGALTANPDDFVRAEDVFEKAADEAAKQENWSAYCEAMIDKATASLRRRQCQPAEQADALSTYAQDLVAIARAMLHGLAEVGEASPQYPQLQVVGRRLAACLVISGEADEDHIAIGPSPRQRSVYAPGVAGSDIFIIPEIDGQYPQHAAGKLRFDASENAATLDEGVATVTFRTLYGKRGYDEWTLLRILTKLYGQDSDDKDGALFRPLVEQIKDQLITSAAPTSSL